MKARLLFIVINILLFNSVNGQKAKDVLEGAINMKNSQSILFTKADVKDTNDNVTEYQIIGTDKIGILKDSLIFLVKGELVKTYITPLNPLDYSFESKNELLPDKIDADAADALKKIVTFVTETTKENSNPKSRGSSALIVDEEKLNKCTPSFESLNKLLTAIQDTLKDDKKKDIVATFSELKKLDFTNEAKTLEAVEKAKKEIEKYKEHYSDIDEKITSLKTEVDKFSCNDESDYVFLMKGMFNQSIKDLISVKKEQYKRVENLNLAFNSVEQMYNLGIANKKICDWCVEVKPNVTLEKGKIASYTLTLKKSGYRLAVSSDKDSTTDEIIAEESKSLTKKVFRFRKFKLFVPEVSSGIVYTNLDYPKYGAVTDDSTGELKVAKIGEDKIKRINITAMLNYNLYADNTDLHPFVQVGAGINTDFPTLLFGTGLRISAVNGVRFAISVGVAMSWIKSLDTLKVGDVVQDDSDVEKDVQYEFAAPKIYYGIQFNF